SDDETSRSLPQGVPEFVGLGARLCSRRFEPANDFERVVEISLSLLRRRQAVRKSAQDRKEDDAGHPSEMAKNSATSRRNSERFIEKPGECQRASVTFLAILLL